MEDFVTKCFYPLKIKSIIIIQWVLHLGDWINITERALSV